MWNIVYYPAALLDKYAHVIVFCFFLSLEIDRSCINQSTGWDRFIKLKSSRPFSLNTFNIKYSVNEDFRVEKKKVHDNAFVNILLPA